MEIYGKYSVYLDGSHVGHLTVSQVGLMTEFNCECILATSEVLRLAILCGDKYRVFGVMLPDGDRLRCIKRFSKNELTRMSIDSIDGCKLARAGDSLTPEKPIAVEAAVEEEAESVPPEENAIEPAVAQETVVPEENKLLWQFEERPWELFADEEFRDICKNITGALRMTVEGVTLLAIPLVSGEPFPAMPIFCFGESLQIQGEDYLIFKIKNGELVG